MIGNSSLSRKNSNSNADIKFNYIREKCVFFPRVIINMFFSAMVITHRSQFLIRCKFEND